MNEQHSINDVVWVIPYDGYAVVIGVTPRLNLVVRWYNDDGEQFTAIVTQEEVQKPNE
jgi:hypothetical protein